MKKLHSYQPFPLECGHVLPQIDIAYFTYGALNEHKDNVIWICHALTANADAEDWWSGLIGEGKIFDPAEYFIVCANVLGSCYGATNANSINPQTRQRYGKDFPIITIRDVVKSHQILQQHLGINKIALGIGGSLGGQQVLEWAIASPMLFEQICVLATNAKHSAWGIAFNESQRMALEADPTLFDDSDTAGKAGLEAARSFALLSYRNYATYARTQDDNDEKLKDYRSTTYQRYQGQKLSNRFAALPYYSLTHTMDSHDVGRGRGGIENALAQIVADTLVIGIETDILFPITEQIFLSTHIPNACFENIDSPFGHDGFLIENEKMTTLIGRFLKNNKKVRKKRNFLAIC